MQKPQKRPSFYSVPLGFLHRAMVKFPDVPTFWIVRESNHYRVQKPKRPLSDKQPPRIPEKLIHAFSYYKIGKHFEVAEDN